MPLTGFAGQVCLCQMSFAAIGAIVMAHHGQRRRPAGARARSPSSARSVGAIVALPSLRLSGIYLALATAAFAVFLDRWVFRLPAFDLGPWHLDGGEPYQVQLFDLGVIPVQPLDVPGIDTTSRPPQLVVLSP